MSICTNSYLFLLQQGRTEDKFVTEIAVKLQPLDIVLSPNTIGTILNVLNPLLKMPGSGAPSRPVVQPQAAPLTNITSSTLPLLYLDLMAVRIILPAANSHCQHDVILIQVCYDFFHFIFKLLCVS